MHQIGPAGKIHARFAPPDPEHDFAHEIGAGVRKGDAAVRDRRAFLLALHDQLVKSFRLLELAARAQTLDNFPDRFPGSRALQIEREIFFRKKIRQRKGRHKFESEFDAPRADVESFAGVASDSPTADATKEVTVSHQSSIYDPGYVNAMSHFYRGELSRIMTWRTRLDTTTNWAITSSTAIITISFSNAGVPHLIFFFNLAIVWMLLWIEARRYRFYDAFRARVRMLEAHFLVPMVMENRNLLQGEWKKLVCEDLILPSFKISKLEAVGRRLKRNYVFIFILIMVAWVLKIFLHAKEPIDSVPAFYRALRVGHIPSWFVAFIFVGTLVSVIGITIYVGKKTSGEIAEFGSHRSLWRI